MYLLIYVNKNNLEFHTILEPTLDSRCDWRKLWVLFVLICFLLFWPCFDSLAFIVNFFLVIVLSAVIITTMLEMLNHTPATNYFFLFFIDNFLFPLGLEPETSHRASSSLYHLSQASRALLPLILLSQNSKCHQDKPIIMNRFPSLLIFLPLAPGTLSSIWCIITWLSSNSSRIMLFACHVLTHFLPLSHIAKKKSKDLKSFMLAQTNWETAKPPSSLLLGWEELSSMA